MDTISLLEFISGQAEKLKAERKTSKEGGETTGESGTGVGGKKTKGGRKKLLLYLMMTNHSLIRGNKNYWICSIIIDT